MNSEKQKQRARDFTDLVLQSVAIPNGFAQANELTEASYSLTKQQKRILYMIVSRMRKATQKGVNSLDACEITVAEYAKIYAIESRQASKEIREAFADFSGREVRLYNAHESTETELAVENYPWLIKRAHSPRRGVYIVHLNPYLAPFFIHLDSRFTQLKISNLQSFRNPLAMRLYESLCQYQKTDGSGFAILGVDWMRDRYQMPETYAVYAEFKRKFIKPAIQEIEKAAKMRIEFTEVKRGSKIEQIRFTFAACGKKGKTSLDPDHEWIAGVLDS